MFAPSLILEHCDDVTRTTDFVLILFAGIRTHLYEGNAGRSGPSRSTGITGKRQQEVQLRTWQLTPESLGPSITKPANKPKQA